MPTRIEDFLNIGYTSKSEVPSGHNILSTYHPAVGGGGTYLTYRLMTSLDANNYVEMIPIRNRGSRWKRVHLLIFRNLRLKLSGDQLIHKHDTGDDVIDEIGDYQLINFTLSKNITGSISFIAELEWRYRQSLPTIKSKWFWIPK